VSMNSARPFKPSASRAGALTDCRIGVRCLVEAVHPLLTVTALAELSRRIAWASEVAAAP
jgi:hypothetical protein